MANVLNEIAEAAVRVTERAGTAVVAIGRSGRGAGIVVAVGRVLTNAHNLRDRTTTVTFADGRALQGALVGVDVDGDLAILEVDTGGATAVEWADAGAVHAGAAVFALANPGARGLRATFGTVSAVDQCFRGPRGRRISDAFEHTAPLGRGSSGGPVVDADGRLLGVNTNRLGDGFYLALPADAALRERVEALGRGESPQRRELGVGLAPSHVANRLRAAVGLPSREGLLVQRVAEDSPAAGAGIQRGDLLVAVDGRPLQRADDLLDALEALADGASLNLDVVRGAEERAVSVGFDRERGEAGSV
ncbi:MAG: trypsin-like peptidase domain-containing protein [Euzebyales bacterium]|nr:trypsin-like peptidase domain-containing protein [Euzebyales bacterium]